MDCGNVIAVSGLSVNTYLLTRSACPYGFSAVSGLEEEEEEEEEEEGFWSSGAQISLTACGDDYLNFCRVFYFHFLSEFYIRSGFYFRNRGGTSTTPYM